MSAVRTSDYRLLDIWVIPRWDDLTAQPDRLIFTMNKNLAGFILAIILVLIGYLAVNIKQNINAGPRIVERIDSLPFEHLSNRDGQPFHAQALRDDRPLVVIFFSTKCGYCRSEIAGVRDHARLQASATFLLVSLEESPALEEFAREFELENVAGLFVVRDREGSFFSRLGVRRVPYTIIYGASGYLQQAFKGEVSGSIIFKAITSE